MTIYGVEIEDPFNIKTVNAFIESPPFGLFDIFNHLIYHAADYDKQGLAAYKSYEDYRLFEDGYVRSLETVTIKEAGIHLYVGQVQPSMRTKTEDKNDHYGLWFILEGKGPNKGTVIDAFCKCKGGRDGGCKHISAEMYSLEELLNTPGEMSVTSGPCLWVAKPKSSTEPCEVKELDVKKVNRPRATKKKKRKYTWLQHIDFDPKSKKKLGVHSKERLASFTRNATATNQEPSDRRGNPVILPLLKKLYLPIEVQDEEEHEKVENIGRNCPTMQSKVEKYVQENDKHTPQQLLNSLSFSDAEIDDIDKSTVCQWQCKEWHVHKMGFLSASKCKDICTRQTTLDKKNDSSTTLLAQSIVSNKPFEAKVIPDEPQNPREWGLKHENSARDAYLRVQQHLHHNVRLTHRGFRISPIKPFMGVSVDDIRSCECICECKTVIVEFKCPMFQREDPGSERSFPLT